MNLTSPWKTAPRADRFRTGDHWRAPNGQTFRVCKGLTADLVRLVPIGHRGATVHLRVASVAGFMRTRWGGEP